MEVFLDLTKDDEILDDQNPQVSSDQYLPSPRKRSKIKNKVGNGMKKKKMI